MVRQRSDPTQHRPVDEARKDDRTAQEGRWCAGQAETDFGQSDFGHPYWPTLANSDFGQTDFGQKNLTYFGQP